MGILRVRLASAQRELSRIRQSGVAVQPPAPVPIIPGSLAEPYSATLSTWLGCSDPLVLLYSNYTGVGLNEFHRTCDGQGNTISLCFGDGIIFGCFSPAVWRTGDGQHCPDRSSASFMFTLLNSSAPEIAPTLFPLRQNRTALWSDARHSVAFGLHDGWSDVFITADGQANVHFPRSYEDTIGTGVRTFGPNPTFRVTGIEVWQVPESAVVARGPSA
jgi:hypothetical protein